MLDLDAMRKEREAKPELQPVKTYLTAPQRERLRSAAERAGRFEYEVLGALIDQFLPAPEGK